MVIGDGFSDPENMLNYGDYLYNIGLVDQTQRIYFRSMEAKARDFIKNEKFMEAFMVNR